MIYTPTKKLQLSSQYVKCTSWYNCKKVLLEPIWPESLLCHRLLCQNGKFALLALLVNTCSKGEKHKLSKKLN